MSEKKVHEEPEVIANPDDPSKPHTRQKQVIKPGKTVATASSEKSQTVEEIDLNADEAPKETEGEKKGEDTAAQNNAQTRAVSYLR